MATPKSTKRTDIHSMSRRKETRSHGLSTQENLGGSKRAALCLESDPRDGEKVKMNTKVSRRNSHEIREPAVGTFGCHD